MPERGDEEARARDAEVIELTRAVRELTDRVAALERSLGPAVREEPAARPLAPVRAVVTPATRPAAEPPPRLEDLAPRVPPVSPSLPGVDRERLPVIVMGAAGGIALLMGTLYFAWYSIQQGWVSPEVRLSLTGLFGMCAMGGAWVLAPRGHRTVAASLGGAGLGGWFGAVLVARHSYAFLSPAATFALLVLGAGVGIWIATQRRLRFLATLAAIAAVVTPLSIGYYQDRLHERMAYQLVVVVFLYAIEQRRRWVELGALAVLGTWALLFSWTLDTWGEENLLGVVGWSFVYLIVGQLQSWRLLRRRELSNLAATPRLWINSYAAWLVAGFAAEGNNVAYTALAMALVNGVAAWALFGVLAGRATSGGPLPAEDPEGPRPEHWFWQRACLAACSSVAWLQVFAFAPLRWNTDTVLVWWCAMAALVTVLHLRRPSYAYVFPFLLPLAAALGYSADHDTTTAAALGFGVAALPLLIALWPSRAEVESRPARFDLYLALQLGLGCLAWAVMSLAHFGKREPGEGWFMLLCVAASVPVSLRVIAAASRARSAMHLISLTALVISSIMLSVGSDLFDALEGFGTERLWQIGGLLGIAALALNLGARFKQDRQAEDALAWRGRIHDLAGVLRPGALLVIAMLLVSGSVTAITEDIDNARSINQAGWSLCWAVAGLSLLLRGLRAGRGLWRGAGMFVLFATGAKLVLVDLVHVSMIWRVLSFVGLGACLLLGALAYRKLGASSTR